MRTFYELFNLKISDLDWILFFRSSENNHEQECQGSPFLRVPFFRNGTRLKIRFFFWILKHNETCITSSALFSEKVAMGSVLGNPEPKPGSQEWNPI